MRLLRALLLEREMRVWHHGPCRYLQVIFDAEMRGNVVRGQSCFDPTSQPGYVGMVMTCGISRDWNMVADNAFSDGKCSAPYILLGYEPMDDCSLLIN